MLEVPRAKELHDIRKMTSATPHAYKNKISAHDAGIGIAYPQG